MGAILYAGSTAHRVYAPLTHALPVIRCVPDPFSSTNRQTEIELITYKNGLHLLKQVSTRFGGIWNDNHLRIDGPTPAARAGARSFALVSSIRYSQYLDSINTVEDIRSLPEPSQEAYKAITNIRTVGIAAVPIFGH